MSAVTGSGIQNRPSFKSDVHTNDLDYFKKEELGLAFRNHGIHYEGLREDITPVGMHYLLVHFDIPKCDWDSHRLRIVEGERTMEITMEDILARPKVSLAVTMECAGNGRIAMKPRLNVSQPWEYQGCGTAVWSGTPLRPILEEFLGGRETRAVEVLLTGKDKGIQHGEVQLYQRSLPFAEALHPDVLLAYEMNGQKLMPQHGFPLRLVVPGYYGMTNVKWLTTIEFIDHKFNGVQMKSYIDKQSKDDVGLPVTEISVRSLMVPPGIPDWFNRFRFVEAGDILLEGRAWAGRNQIEKVEVVVDGIYHQASMEEPVGKYAWRRWTFLWKVSEGRYVIGSRATDSKRNVQSESQVWNYGGFKNNVVQTIKVVVKDPKQLAVGAKIDLNKEADELEKLDLRVDSFNSKLLEESSD